MNIGDKVRLRVGPPCQEIFGLKEGEVGIVKDIDMSCDSPSVLISFPDMNFYTTAFRNDDFEVLPSGLQPNCLDDSTE